MYNFFGSDTPDNVPVFKFGDDGRISNIRPTMYHRESLQKVQQHGAKGRIGYLVQNNYGDPPKRMTFKQAARLKDLFDRGMLKIVDWWVSHHVDPAMGMAGYDTEMEGHGSRGMYTMPAFGE